MHIKDTAVHTATAMTEDCYDIAISSYFQWLIDLPVVQCILLELRTLQAVLENFSSGFCTLE